MGPAKNVDGDAEREIRALTESAAVLDLSYRSRLALLGSERLKFLNGQVTNNVKDLRPGSGVYAALVNAKARIQSDLNIHALKEELLIDFEPGLSGAVRERLEKYIVADDVQVADAAPHFGLLSVQGPRAADAVAELRLGFPLPAHWMQIAWGDSAGFGQLYVAQRPRTGSSGYDIYVAREKLQELLEAARQAVEKIGGRAAGWEALEEARIQAGIPRFGQDMDESNLAPEAGIEPLAISYNKGCYIGQEIISRLKSFGQLVKILRRLEVGPHPVPPAKGSKLVRDGKEAGYLTSCASRPSSNGYAALGYVRREHWNSGAELVVMSEAGEIPARVAGPVYALASDNQVNSGHRQQ